MSLKKVAEAAPKKKKRKRSTNKWYNPEALKWWCNSSETKIFNRVEHVCETPGGRLSYLDRGAEILAVAHLDTALRDNHFFLDDGVVYSPALDDRLGAYIITDYLPSRGVVMDILLTEGEECGMSTAEYFDPQKEYKWIVSFDRAGTDVVMYEYEDDYCEDILEEFGFGKCAWGSFSDICWLEHLECKAFNIGVGYKSQHTKLCHADLDDTASQIEKFVTMWEKMKDTHLPHTECKSRFSMTSWKKGKDYDYDEDYYKWIEYESRVIEEGKKKIGALGKSSGKEELLFWQGHMFAYEIWEEDNIYSALYRVEDGDIDALDDLWYFYIGEVDEDDEIELAEGADYI